MQCVIYKSLRKQDSYLYLTVKEDISRVPDALLKLLGELVHVMDLDLFPGRRLAQEDVADVLQNLRERGWHLQMPRQNEWQGVRH